MDLLRISDFNFGASATTPTALNITAQTSGPIALAENSDKVTIDVESHRIDVDLTDEQLAGRREKWPAPPYNSTWGPLFKYIKSVKSASEGCVTDE